MASRIASGAFWQKDPMLPYGVAPVAPIKTDDASSISRSREACRPRNVLDAVAPSMDVISGFLDKGFFLSIELRVLRRTSHRM
jgi:hypothetical protein